MTIHAHELTFKAMGSRCELKLYGSIPEVFIIADKAVGLVRELEQKYTRYRADSITSQINAGAGSEFIKLDEETSLLIDYAATLYEQSEGLFDITSGVLRRAWNFKAGHLPSPTQIAALLPLIGWHKVEWSPPFLRLSKEGMEIDLGGFVKEYAADRVVSFCMSEGISHGLVNLGGDIRVIGPHPDGSPWQVGIQHPRQPQAAIATVALTGGAITTSGDYERFMLINGKRYCHLLNPKTGESLQPFYASASVVAPQCLLAGSFSTLALLRSTEDPSWLDTIELPFLVVDQQMRVRGSIQNTSNI